MSMNKIYPYYFGDIINEALNNSTGFYFFGNKFIEFLEGQFDFADSGVSNNDFFIDISAYNVVSWDTDNSEWVLNKYCQKILNLVGRRCKDNIAYVIRKEWDDEPSVSEIIKKNESLALTILNILESSAEKYIMLCGFYEAKQNDLLNAVKIITNDDTTSTLTSLFNDTPQEAGDFLTDNHTTNASKDTNILDKDVTVSDDRETLMNRLEEVQNKYRNLIYEWSQLFERCFLESGNYEN